MADNDKSSYPRIPESNWWTIRDQFAKTLPAKVNPSYLKSLLQLINEKSAQNLVAPLRQIGLIDTDGKPTNRANSWRNNSTYAKVCLEMLDEIYPQELRDLYSGKDIQRESLIEWFKSNTTLGDTAATASASLYILLNEATPKSSAEFAKSKQGAGKKNLKPKVDKQNNSGTESKESSSNVAIPKPLLPTTSGESYQSKNNDGENKKDNWFSLHIDLQIHISPEASAEQIDQIFSSMAKHIITMRKPTADDK
jgi:hypothetical protein